jgi:hypothetical protein
MYVHDRGRWIDAWSLLGRRTKHSIGDAIGYGCYCGHVLRTFYSMMMTRLRRVLVVAVVPPLYWAARTPRSTPHEPKIIGNKSAHGRPVNRTTSVDLLRVGEMRKAASVGPNETLDLQKQCAGRKGRVCHSSNQGGTHGHSIMRQHHPITPQLVAHDRRHAQCNQPNQQARPVVRGGDDVHRQLQ